MTLKQIEELEALAAKATPGPWSNATWLNCVMADGARIATIDSAAPHRYKTVDNAEFIVASREAVPALCAALSEAVCILRYIGEPSEWNHEARDITGMARAFLEKFEDKSGKRE